MKALVYDRFRGPIELRDVPDPSAPPGGVVVRVGACGLCRSDWHGWMGHDADVTLPNVPGHELAGVVDSVGEGVTRWRGGERVTVPFCIGCGSCPECEAGHPQVCDRYVQPGFTIWGAFAERVALPHAEYNLVALPAEIDDVTAASLGCRFGTAFRAIVDQGRVTRGEWVAVFGCGGVGLAAIMIAADMGARVIAVDLDPGALALAREVGARASVDAGSLEVGGTPDHIRALTGGGVHLSLDAFGSARTCVESIRSLRKRGRHVQVGVMAGADARPPIAMGEVMGRELELIGSHGVQAERYGTILKRVVSGRLDPARLVSRRVSLGDVAGLLATFQDHPSGITVMVAS